MALEKKKMKKNCIRTATNTILNSFEEYSLSKRVIGLIYIFFHYFIMISGAFIICFNTNIVHLCCTLMVISLDAFSIVVLHGCPLTQLEQKYLNTNTSEDRYQFFKQCGIVYTCQHQYDKQIELLVNVWLLIAAKCLLITCFNTFKIKLHNTNQLYT
jgi:hypothetical protein